MEFKPLIPVGAKIKVNKQKIENVLPKKLFDELPKTINCEVIDYKMTDGMGIGYVLMTENKHKIWIFKNELNEETKKEYNLEDINIPLILDPNESLLGKLNFTYDINGNRSIKSLANPINIISWLVFTLKDIL
tara:strand:+ start:103 stop:501 length:399 start_codon:yes stop_codon:yes gene_type:complete